MILMQRLQKIIAEKGYCSRRKAEELITKGLVKSNKDALVIECPCCHNRWGYQRMAKIVKYPSYYRCGKCKENLVRIK